MGGPLLVRLPPPDAGRPALIVGEFRVACRVDELGPGCALGVEIEGRAVALFNVGGVVRAVEDTCLHAGGPLHAGSLSGSVVTCPWHGWQFDVEDGSCDLNPMVRLRRYPTRVRDGLIEVEV